MTHYEEGFPLWRNILNQKQFLRVDNEIKVICQEGEARYIRLIDDLLGLEMPDQFKPRPFDKIYNRLDLKPVVRSRDLER